MKCMYNDDRDLVPCPIILAAPLTIPISERARHTIDTSKHRHEVEIRVRHSLGILRINSWGLVAVE
jgi:hypothetical protein